MQIQCSFDVILSFICLFMYFYFAYCIVFCKLFIIYKCIYYLYIINKLFINIFAILLELNVFLLFLSLMYVS